MHGRTPTATANETTVPFAVAVLWASCLAVLAFPAAMQAQVEVWLSRRDGAIFTPLRRLRRLADFKGR